MLCQNRNIEIKDSPTGLQIGTVAVERAIQTLRNLKIAYLEDKIGSTKFLNRSLTVMRFTIHTGLKVSPFELYHGRKLSIELTNIIKDNKSYLSDWTTLNVSVPPKQILSYVARNENMEGMDHIIMARKRKIPFCASHKSPKRRPVKPVSGNFPYPYTFFEKRNQKISLGEKNEEQPRIAVDGTEHTVRTAYNEISQQKLLSTPVEFQRSPKKDLSPK